jgi:hypothetical protein
MSFSVANDSYSNRPTQEKHTWVATGLTHSTAPLFSAILALSTACHNLFPRIGQYLRVFYNNALDLPQLVWLILSLLRRILPDARREPKLCGTFAAPWSYMYVRWLWFIVGRLTFCKEEVIRPHSENRARLLARFVLDNEEVAVEQDVIARLPFALDTTSHVFRIAELPLDVRVAHD